SLVLVFSFLTETTATASPKPLELHWGELSSKILNRSIELTLPDGSSVGGEVVVVREDAIVLNIRKTTSLSAYPKGSYNIPRSSVTLVKLIETHGQWGRKMGTVLGVIGGGLVGGYTAMHTVESGGAAAAIFGGIT